MRRVLAIALATSLAGCMTTSEGNKLRAEIVDLKSRMDKRESDTAAQVTKLNEAIDNATKLLGQGSANLGARVDGLESKMSELTGTLAEAKHLAEELKKSFDDYRSAQGARIAELEARVDKVAAGPPKPAGPPEDKAALFEEAYKKLLASDHAGARQYFQLYVQKFPDDERADNAQFWVAETYFSQRDFGRAIGEYQKVLDKYGKGDVVDDAYFKLGMSAAEMKWCTDAAAYLRDGLIKKFPKSPLVPDAKAKLKELEKNAKNKKLCTS